MIRWALLSIIIATLSIASWERNKAWQTEIGLMEDVVSKAPQKERGWANLGAAYILAGNYSKGKECSIRAIQLDNSQYYSYYNLSIAEDGLKNYEAAYLNARKAATMHKDTVTLWQLGTILKKMGYQISQDGKTIVKGGT